MEKTGRDINKKRRYFLGLTNNDNWFVIKNKCVFGINSINKEYLSMKKGDLFLFYILKKRKIGNILFEVITKKELKNDLFSGSKQFNNGILLRPLLKGNTIKLKKDIINKLSFIQNKVYWGGSLMGRSIIELKKKDFILFEKILLENNIDDKN